ncbi:hypothetical protein [Singulisphaera sp. PoT]|uniref:hypothetical protein n=1 Tax=Singulisphaera sp. PoT TaxID=3411797 RepID=UPI003BF4A096
MQMSQGGHRRGFLRAALYLAAPLVVGAAGCGGSKSGNMVEMSEEAKAQLQSRRDSYKARAATKAKARGGPGRSGKGSSRKG